MNSLNSTVRGGFFQRLSCFCVSQPPLIPGFSEDAPAQVRPHQEEEVQEVHRLWEGQVRANHANREVPYQGGGGAHVGISFNSEMRFYEGLDWLVVISCKETWLVS